MGLLRSRSLRERLRIVTRFLDALEQDYQAAYGSESSGEAAPFAEGCEEALERVISIMRKEK